MNAPVRLAALVLFLASAPALAVPTGLLSPALGRPDSVTLQGRVLADTPHGSTALLLTDMAPFLVISDFDDTLAISEVTQPDKLVANALLRDADTQKVVRQTCVSAAFDSTRPQAGREVP